MGGAAGHFCHIYENFELTFGEIKDILTRAAEGRLERVSEKFDGVNVVFTYDLCRGELRVARTGNDIKVHGMDLTALKLKFQDRPNVQDAFTTGFKVLEQALCALNANTMLQVFGPKGNRWYSLEIIYSGLSNTINYDKEHIVFHGWPVYVVDECGDVDVVEDCTGVDILKKNIESMQRAVSMSSWRVCGPSIVRLQALSDGTVLKVALENIDAAMNQVGVDDSSTLSDYIFNCALGDVQRFGFLDHVSRMVALRLAKRKPTLTQIKKAVTKDQYDKINAYVKGEKELKRAWMRPIEDAIYCLSLEVLKGLHSSLVANGEAEVSRLRKRLGDAIKAIQSSENDEALAVLEKHMDRLQSLENIASSMEGVVFIYKGCAYKFTGAFAPAHQIISMFTYGRQGVQFDANTLTLGHAGQALGDVSPITMSQFNKTWPELVEDLEDLGVVLVEAIGSTGKNNVMSDIDVMGECESGRDEVFTRLVSVLGKENVKRFGSNTISFAYPIKETDKHVQVDLMLGDTDYIRWARFGTSTNENHPDYSPVKGGLRNMLLNTAFRVFSGDRFLNEQALERRRYVIDFERGLYFVKQSKKGKLRELKNYKTVERQQVSSDPTQIIRVLVGDGYTADDVLTFEGLVRALKESDQTKHLAPRMFREFLDEIESEVPLGSKIFGGDGLSTIQYIRSCFNAQR